MADNKDKTVSSTSSPDEKAKAAAEGKSIEVDHGKAPDALKEQDKAAEKTERDPWGDTPMQMRDDHPNDDIQGRSVAVDGIAPHAQDLPEDEGVSGGTLPPV